MDLIFIKEFTVLAQTCNFQIAAESLSMSQSALSKHIQKLEEELGHSLFDRSKRNATLNPYGQVFLEYAKQLCKTFDECERALNELAEDDKNSLSIGFMKVLGQYSLIEQLTDFKIMHPDIQMTMFEQSGDQIKSKLTSGECDFIFTAETEGFSDDQFCKVFYWSERMVAVLPPDHRLSDREILSVDDLKSEKIIKHNTPRELRILDRLFENCDTQPEVIATISSSSAILQMVSQGLGISILSEGCARRYKSYSLKKAALSPSAEFPIYLIYLRRRQSKAAREFINYFKELNSSDLIPG